MEFSEVIRINPMVQINEIKKERSTLGNQYPRFVVSGFVDLDESSGTGGQFTIKMKSKSFTASFNSSEELQTGTMSMIDLFNHAK